MDTSGDTPDQRAPTEPTDQTRQMDQADEVAFLVQFFKALADETRLRILGLLASQERSVEELATLLRLKAPTVSHHLARLKELDLIAMRAEGNTHVYWLRADTLRAVRRRFPAPKEMASFAYDVEGDAWERKVLRDFFEGERLKEIPAALKKRRVILQELVRHFEPQTLYTEAQVNETLKRFHPDTASLRRELIGEKLLQRERGIYWRTSPAPSPVSDA